MRWLIARESFDEAVSGLTVLREKVKYEQQDPSNRTIERELALLNETDEDVRDFRFVLEQFLPGLSVRDGMGDELSYLPTAAMEAQVGPIPEFLQELAGETYTARLRLLWIVFPTPVKPGETRFIKLTFEDEEEPSSLNFIPQPWFRVAVGRSVASHDTFIEVRAPPDGVLVLAGGEGMPEKGKDSTPAGVKQTVLERFLQIRVPAGHPGVGFRYKLRPLRREVIVLWAAFLILSLIPVAMLAGAFTGHVEIVGPENRAGEIVATLGITGILGIVGFLHPQWTNRAWYLLPLVPSSCSCFSL